MTVSRLTAKGSLVFHPVENAGHLLLPTNLLIAIGLVGVVLMATRFASLGRRLVDRGDFPSGHLRVFAARNSLLYPLEQRFPPWDASRGAPDGIIILGGSIDADLSVAHGTPVVSGAPDRIIAAAALARRYPNARVVFSGGSANLSRTMPRKPISPVPFSKASASTSRG